MRGAAFAAIACLGAGVSADELAWRQENASLSLSGYMQFRSTLNARDVDIPGAEAFSRGFSLRRTRLTASGEVGEISYKLTASFSRNGGDAGLSDGYVRLPLTGTVSIQAGQFKEPFLKEELTSAKRLLAADRSNTNGVFTLSRSQGVMVDWALDRHRGSVMLHDGGDGANTDWDESIADVALAGRGEWLVAGDSFQPFREATSPRGTGLSVLIGAAADYESLDQPSTIDNVIGGTVDVDVKGDGWGAMAAGIMRHEWGEESFTDFGLVTQGSVYVSERTELFGRADVVFTDSDRPEDDPFPGFTVGATHYMLGHAAKLTVDLQYFPVGTRENSLVTGGNTGIGLLESDGSQVVGRVQVQVVF